MSRSLRIVSFVGLTLALVFSGWGTSAFTASAQTRLRRAPERDLETTPIVTAGAQALPAGTIIILEMETRLSSKEVQVGDKFRAHVASPVADTSGKTIIPVGILVEGHVSAVSKAKWAHRSGIIGIVFDNFRSPDGRIQPVRATLTSSDAEDRKRLDDEGYVKGGNPTRRDIVFIGGGAGAGVGIGAITGGMLAGGAIGAAAGLTATLLLKGKEAVIKERERFGMELVQDFSLANNPFGIASITPTRPTARRTPTPIYRQPSTGPLPGPLDPVDVTAERGQDGVVRLRINAETPTANWRVFTHHDVLGDIARVRLRGTPPSRSVYDSYSQQSFISPAQEICLNDRGGTLRRAEILGKNGVVRVAVNIPAQPGSSFARAQARSQNTYSGNNSGYTPGYYPPNYNPETGGTVPPPRPVNQPTPTPTGVSTLAQNVVTQVELIRTQYAGATGYFLNADGSYRFIGTRQPTQDQQQLMDSLGSLLNSLRELRTNASNPYTRRSSALKVQEDLRATQQLWNRVRLDASLNNRWTAVSRDIDTLLNQTLR